MPARDCAVCECRLCRHHKIITRCKIQGGGRLSLVLSSASGNTSIPTVQCYGAKPLSAQVHHAASGTFRLCPWAVGHRGWPARTKQYQITNNSCHVVGFGWNAGKRRQRQTPKSPARRPLFNVLPGARGVVACSNFQHPDGLEGHGREGGGGSAGSKAPASSKCKSQRSTPSCGKCRGKGERGSG